MTDAEQTAWLSLTAVLSAACSTVPLHVALRSLAGLYGALVGNLATSHPDLARAPTSPPCTPCWPPRWTGWRFRRCRGMREGHGMTTLLRASPGAKP